MLDRKWTTLSKEPVADLVTEIRKLVDEGDRVIHIGTDAQKIDRKVDFVTCIALVKPMKGGRVFYTKIRHAAKEINGLQQKLFTETQNTIETALALTEHFGDEAEFVIHLDVNPDVRWQSSRHIKQVVGWVMGSGFQHVLTKPDAWLASHACDHAVKGKNNR